MSSDESIESAVGQHPSNGELVVGCRGLERYLGVGEGRVHVLRGVALEARRGQVNAIVGPSGCGKSTLLYLLGLLDRPDGGSIHIGQKDVVNASDEERKALWPKLNAMFPVWGHFQKQTDRPFPIVILSPTGPA